MKRVKTDDGQKVEPRYPNNNGVKEICKLMRELQHGHNIFDVFRDFCSMAACALSNSADHRPKQHAAREAEYAAVVKKYKPEQVKLFPQMLGVLTESLDPMDDILGKVFNELELHNKWAGQFFTPFDVCRMMARMQFTGDELKKMVATQRLITLQEPACGSGALVIAFVEAMLEAGVNPQRHLHVTAIDVDIRAVHMTYVQLSLLGIPAVVIRGNTLGDLKELDEPDCRWYTPVHIVDGWSTRLAAHREPSVDELRERKRRLHVYNETGEVPRRFSALDLMVRR